MMDLTARLEAKAKLAPIVEKLVQGYAPDRVYLFGSLASGTFSEESDADLLVVKTTAQGALERSWEVYRIIQNRDIPVDIIVLTPKELQQRLKEGDPFIQDILAQGVLLYERRGSRSVGPGRARAHPGYRGHMMKRWLQRAEKDLKAAQSLAANSDLWELACFHAQQAVEKYLKGFLSARQRDIPRTHDLGRLIALCAEIEAEFQTLQDVGAFLNPFYIAARYPEGPLLTISEEVVRKAVDMAATVRGAVLRQVGAD